MIFLNNPLPESRLQEVEALEPGPVAGAEYEVVHDAFLAVGQSQTDTVGAR
jgi:hypothetical protein